MRTRATNVAAGRPTADVEFHGEIELEERRELLGNARALLFPIDWPETFGLVMIEAMSCGTPVIAFRCGSTPEVVEDGVTGFIVNDETEAVAAIKRVRDLDRRAIRQRSGLPCTAWGKTISTCTEPHRTEVS